MSTAPERIAIVFGQRKPALTDIWPTAPVMLRSSSRRAPASAIGVKRIGSF